MDEQAKRAAEIIIADYISCELQQNNLQLFLTIRDQIADIIHLQIAKNCQSCTPKVGT
jgi:hypothetical protein